MNNGGRIYTSNKHLTNCCCHSSGLSAILPKNQRTHEAKHQAEHSHGLSQRLQLFLRQPPAASKAFQAFADCLGAYRNDGPFQYARHRWVHKRARDEHLEKIPALPEALNLPKHQLTELGFQVASRLQFSV